MIATVWNAGEEVTPYNAALIAAAPETLDRLIAFQQQNRDLRVALQKIEILGRDIRSTLATSMGNIAREALSKVKEE